MALMPTTKDSRLDLIRAVLADAALAFVATVVIDLIIASLAAAGIITMVLAYVLLGLAWLVATIGTFLVLWPVAHRHRVIFSCFLACMLATVGWYETKHYVEPPSAKDIAQEVSKLIGPLPEVAQKTVKPESEPKIDGPLISTVGKTYFRCPLPPVPTDRTREQILSDMKERIQAARDTFGVSLQVNDLPNGRQIIMEPITEEAKFLMSGARRWTLEVRKSGPDLLITSILDFVEPLSMLGKLRVDPKSDQTMLEHRYIEEMLHIPSGKCQML
jgi:hypothetical protein